MTADGESSHVPSIVLPPELLDQIAAYLDPRDIANVRLASTQFCQVFTPYLVTHLTLKLSDEVTLSGRSIFAFVPTPDTLAKFITSLRIEFNYYYFTVARQSWREVLLTTYRMQVASLVSLRSLTTTWAVNVPSPDDSLHWLGDMEARLLDAIPDPTRLQHLEIDSFLLLRKSPTSLAKFAQLETFTLNKVIRSPVGYSSITEQINTLLACVPTITTLNIETSFQSSTIFLDDIFPSPSIRPHLSLQSLSFDGCCTWSRAAIPPLTGLPGSYFSNLRQLVVKTGHEDADADWDPFWDLLRHINTRLQDIILAHVPTASFVEYLASYRGLQGLVLPRRPLNPISFNIADLFITHVLPLQASTLQKLFIPIPCIGINPDRASEGFTFTSTWPIPSQFLHLKYLCALSPRGLSFSLETCQSLLEWLEQFPSLEHCIIVFQSFLDDDDETHEFGPSDFRTTGRELSGLTGRPREWTLLYDPNAEIHRCTWKANQGEDGRWNFVDVQQGYRLTWVEQ